MSKKNYSLAVCLVLLIICAQSCKPIKEETVIKIGAIMPLTGDGAKYGETAKNAINLAIDEINEKKSTKKKIEVIFEDSKGDPKTGVLAVQMLISTHNVPVIIGGLFSSVTLAVSPILNKNKVVLLSPTSSAPEITNAGDYIFRNCASDIFEGNIMAEFSIRKMKLEKVAILYVNNDYGLGIKDVFTTNYIKLGGEILISETFDQGTTDFRLQLSKIKKYNPDAIYIIGYKELAQLLRQSRELDINKQFLSTVMFEDPEILKIAGDSAEGVIYSARTYDPKSNAHNIKKFVKKYVDKYNVEPDIFAALSYDAIKIISLAILESNAELTAESIKNYIYTVKHYPGIVGDTTFDKNGDVIQQAVIKIVRGGKFQIYE